MEINAKAKNLIDRAKGKSFVFTARVRFKGEDNTQDMLACYCSINDYGRLSGDTKFDESVFYYFFGEEDIKSSINGVGDFTLEDIVLSGFKFV